MKKIIFFLAIMGMIFTLMSCGQSEQKHTDPLGGTAISAQLTPDQLHRQDLERYQINDSIRDVWIGRTKELAAKMICWENLRQHRYPGPFSLLTGENIDVPVDGPRSQGKNAIFFWIPSGLNHDRDVRIEIDTTQGSEYFKVKEFFTLTDTQDPAGPMMYLPVMMSIFRFEYSQSKKSYTISNYIDLNDYDVTENIPYRVNLKKLEDYYLLFQNSFTAELKRQ